MKFVAITVMVGHTGYIYIIVYKLCDRCALPPSLTYAIVPKINMQIQTFFCIVEFYRFDIPRILEIQCQFE